MKSLQRGRRRILAVAPSTRGMGFAVLEERGFLVDWGVKSASGDKNQVCLRRLEELISQWAPKYLVIEDTSAKGNRRSERIRTLGRRIRALAKKKGILLNALPRREVRKAFFAEGMGTKHALARVLAAQFPNELGPKLPPKRKAFMNEPYSMGIFDAVVLAVAFRMRL